MVGFGGALMVVGLYLIGAGLYAQSLLRRKSEAEIFASADPKKEVLRMRTSAREVRSAVRHRTAYLTIGPLMLVVGVALVMAA